MKPWPCWTCTFRRGPNRAGTYSCARPVSENIAIWERWHLHKQSDMWRSLGTEKQLRGETENITPECPVWERE